MKFKKGLAVLLAIACVLSMVAVASAADVNATVGKTVEFTIKIEEELSAAVFQINVDYDTSVFSVRKYEDEYGDIYDDVIRGSCISRSGELITNDTETGYTLLWYNTSSRNTKLTGDLLTLVFDIDPNAKAGTYPINVECEQCGNIAEEKLQMSLSYPENILVSERDPVDITISDASVLTGDTLMVPVSIAKNEGFASMAFQINGLKGMELVNIHEGELLKNAGGSMTFNPATGIVLWTASSENPADIVGDGEILVLEYQVPEEFEAGVYELNMALKDDLAANFVDINEVKIPANFHAGKITVIDYIPGDVNDDGVVSVLDAVLMARNIVGYETLEGKAFKSADLDKDGYVTAKDCLRMSKYFAGLIDSL